MTVYAVISGRGAPASCRGRTGERLRILRVGAVAAVVSNTGNARAPSPANLRRYERTIGDLARRFPALLPVRFGTRMAEEELIFILRSRRAGLLRALAHVRGRAQMTVRIVNGGRNRNQGVQREEAVATSLQISGTAYLIARARVAAAAQTVPGFGPVRQAVARWVRDEHVEHRGGVYSIYHLIPRTSADAYRVAIEASAVAADVKAVVTGPWPPYAFGTNR